jgi:hypothetical protein
MNKPFKNCNGCKAINGSGNRQFCCLQYKCELIAKDMKYATIYELRPTEICPKPKTNSEYIYLSQMNHK